MKNPANFQLNSSNFKFKEKKISIQKLKKDLNLLKPQDYQFKTSNKNSTQKDKITIENKQNKVKTDTNSYLNSTTKGKKIVTSKSNIKNKQSN